MTPKIEIIKEGLANVRGGLFNIDPDPPVLQQQDCIMDCLKVNSDIIGSIKGKVTTEEPKPIKP